jgi:hypothetical protein
MSNPHEDKNRTSEADSSESTAHQPVSSGREPAVSAGQRSRRRFGKIALGVTPVVATLYGRPLWAAANCTPSGWVSGNTSNHHELGDCAGKTPGYWQGPASKRQHSGWNDIHDKLLNSSHGFPGLNYYVAGQPATMQQAVEGPGKTAFRDVGMLERQLVRFGTAALLNARFVIGYSLTQDQVAEMVAMAILDGRYISPGGDYLDAVQVKSFLENTMATPSWGD